MRTWVVGAVAAALVGVGVAAERKQQPKTAAERGREALLGRAFTPPVIGTKQYDELWKVWGLKEKPADFDRRVRERYGLHDAGYPNAGLPMGLRPAKALLGKGFTNDCLLCHASSICG